MSKAKRAFWKKVVLANWFLLIALAAYLFGRAGVPIKEMPEALRVFIEHHEKMGPLIYIALYILRPLIFFPAAIMTMAAGLIWGPFWGTSFTLIGENLSAAFAFFLARWFGKDLFEESSIRRLHGINKHLKEHGFMTVLITRLIYLPFDAVNYGCGLTKVRFWEFASATFVGILPGVITFIYFGAAWFDTRNLLISGAVFLAGIGVAYFTKHTESGEKIIKAAKL
ncbi:MAG: TVP38/TMEM64 family protein [Elusimicrobiota bacterium]